MFYLAEGIQEGTFTVFFLFFNNGGTFPPPRVHEVLLHCYFCPFSRLTRKAVTLQKTWLGWSDGPEAPLIRMFQEGQQHGDVRSCDQTHTRQKKNAKYTHRETSDGRPTIISLSFHHVPNDPLSAPVRNCSWTDILFPRKHMMSNTRPPQTHDNLINIDRTLPYCVVHFLYNTNKNAQKKSTASCFLLMYFVDC